MSVRRDLCWPSETKRGLPVNLTTQKIRVKNSKSANSTNPVRSSIAPTTTRSSFSNLLKAPTQCSQIGTYLRIQPFFIQYKLAFKSLPLHRRRQTPATWAKLNRTNSPSLHVGHLEIRMKANLWKVMVIRRWMAATAALTELESP